MFPISNTYLKEADNDSQSDTHIKLFLIYSTCDIIIFIVNQHKTMKFVKISINTVQYGVQQYINTIAVEKLVLYQLPILKTLLYQQPNPIIGTLLVSTCFYIRTYVATYVCSCNMQFQILLCINYSACFMCT